MAIFLNKKQNEFHLQTKNTSYIFKILKNNQLGNLYYGKKIKHRSSFEHMLKICPTPASICVFEDDPAFSLETIKQEYPAYGTSDYRQPAYQIEQENGSRITNFEYKSHKIYKGKAKLKGLPATYVENEAEAETLEIILEDSLIKNEIILIYSVFEKRNAITRSVKIKNNNKESVNIKRLMSTSVDLFDSDYEMIQLSGAWARERHLYRTSLRHGIQSIESSRGASSHHQNPFLALVRKNTDEHNGEVYAFSLVYSGNFLAQIEVDHYDTTRVMMGINPFDFNWLLEAGEEFQAPETVMVYSDEGLNGMSKIYNNLYRERLARGSWRDKSRPVLINNWEATYWDFNEEKILKIADESAKLGIELFVLDDGWFGKRDDDKSSLGDWFEYEEKLPNGIKGLAEKIVKKGMKFGLWFEPEMISKQSKLYEKYPEWLLQVKNRRLSPGRNQFVLDFSNKKVIDYVYKMISKILREAQISYVKWDMNRNMTEVGSLELPANRQKETAHRYILGVYELYERLIAEFPDILFESCAGGGGRFDPGMLYYAPQAWTSDDTDAMERLKIQYSTSMVYPISSMGSHVSAVPNHQVRRITPLDTRANVAYFGTFGYELDVNKMTFEEKKRVKEQVEFFKENRDLIRTGDFIRIKSPYESQETSWMVVSQDKKEALVGYYQIMCNPNPNLKKIILKGLDEEKEYNFMYIDGNKEIELGKYYGDELMNSGYIFDNTYFTIPEENSDYSSKLFKLKAL